VLLFTRNQVYTIDTSLNFESIWGSYWFAVFKLNNACSVLGFRSMTSAGKQDILKLAKFEVLFGIIIGSVVDWITLY
jgi:hypothetical protein